MHEVLETEGKGCALKKPRTGIGILIKSVLTAIFVTVITVPCGPSHAQPPPNESQTASWYKFRDPDYKFQCEFPSAPTQTPLATGTYTTQAWGLRIDKDTAYIVATTDYGKTPIKDVQQGFDGARDTILRNQGATLVNEKHVQLAEIPGRSFTARLVSGRTMRARLYFKSGVLYQLIGISPSSVSDNDTLRFFRSFLLISDRR